MDILPCLKYNSQFMLLIWFHKLKLQPSIFSLDLVPIPLCSKDIWHYCLSVTSRALQFHLFFPSSSFFIFHVLSTQFRLQVTGVENLKTMNSLSSLWCKKTLLDKRINYNLLKDCFQLYTCFNKTLVMGGLRLKCSHWLI